MSRGRRRRGEQGVGEAEEDEEGGNFKFSFVFFSVNTFFPVNTLFNLIFFFVNKYYELYIEVLVWLLSPSTILFGIAPKLRNMHFVTYVVVITTLSCLFDLNADGRVLIVFSHKLVSN